MSVGAICFASSGRNGGCWVVLVFPCLFFFLKGGFFSPYATYTKKVFCQKNVTYAEQKATYAYFHNRATLSSS